MRASLFPAILISSSFFMSCGNERKEDAFAIAKRLPGPIDSLMGDAEVEAFVRRQDTTLKEFVLRNVADYDGWKSYEADSLVSVQARKVKPPHSFRGDFDNNGYTDLVVTGDSRRHCGDTAAPCQFDAMLFLQLKDSVSILSLSGFYDGVLSAYPIKKTEEALSPYSIRNMARETACRTLKMYC